MICYYKFGQQTKNYDEKRMDLVNKTLLPTQRRTHTIL